MDLYQFGPFALSSEVALPELPVSKGNSVRTGIQVNIRLGRTPLAVEHAIFQGTSCSATRDEFLLQIEGVASYYIRRGQSIVVQPDAGASALDVRGYLLSNIFAILCHQRRWLPLHASAVRMGGGAVAFLGASGAGKSTLAAYLAQAGYPLVADDICLLDPAAPAGERVMPVAPWLKLWRGSLEALGQGTEGLPHTFSDEDKFRVPHKQGVEEARLPLRAVVILDRPPEAAAGGVQLLPLKPVEAIASMMEFTYQAYLIDWLGLRAEHFTACGNSLGDARAYRCERAWDFDSLPAVLASLRAELS